MMVPELILENLPVRQLQCNCTILSVYFSGKEVVVDPGGDS